MKKKKAGLSVGFLALQYVCTYRVMSLLLSLCLGGKMELLSYSDRIGSDRRLWDKYDVQYGQVLSAVKKKRAFLLLNSQY